MSDDPETAHERAAIQQMMRRFDGFARGLGLSETTTRQVAEKVVAAMVMRADGKRMIEARTRMIEAFA